MSKLNISEEIKKLENLSEDEKFDRINFLASKQNLSKHDRNQILDFLFSFDKSEYVDMINEQIKIQEELNANLELNNEVVSIKNSLGAIFIRFRTTGNELLNINNILTKVLNTLKIALIEKLEVQILEVTRNINRVSAMTTLMSSVNLMWANLTAEGNRAARKLASLKVSSTGKFSISDSGISAADRASISEAQKALSFDKANQVFFSIGKLADELKAITTQAKTEIKTQNNQIVITPTITINNANNLDVKQLTELINAQFASTLQKQIGTILV